MKKLEPFTKYEVIWELIWKVSLSLILVSSICQVNYTVAFPSGTTGIPKNFFYERIVDVNTRLFVVDTEDNIYYRNDSEGNALYRVKAPLYSEKEIITASPIKELKISNGFIYYIDGADSFLYKLNVTTLETEQLTTRHTKNIYIDNDSGFVYFLDTGNRRLYSYDPNTEVSEKIYDGNAYKMIGVDSEFYYIVVSDGTTSQLAKILKEDVTQKVYSPVLSQHAPTLIGDYIYFFSNGSRGYIYRIEKTGLLNEELVLDSRYVPVGSNNIVYDEEYFYVRSYQGDYMYRVNIATGVEEVIINTGIPSAFHKSKKYLYYTSTGNNIYRLSSANVPPSLNINSPKENQNFKDSIGIEGVLTDPDNDTWNLYYEVSK